MTGGAGFIGSHVVDALIERGDEVVVVDNLASGKRENLNPDARFLEADIRDDLDVWDELRPDLCFHLAAQADVNVSVRRPDYDADVNVLGTVRLLEGARRHGTQLIFSSTGGAMYGECEEPAPETKPPAPMSPYGMSKQAGEGYLAGWNRLHGTRHVALRFANVFGERQDSGLEGGVVAIFLERMARGEETTIFGDGERTRDFVYVGDVVRGMLAAVGRDGGGPFNIGTGVEASVLDLAGALAALSPDRPFEPRHEPERLGEIRHIALDTTRAREELGWEARVGLEEGLRLTLESLR